MEFQDIDPDNIRAPVTFQFIAQFVSKLERNYRANPSLFDLDFLPLTWELNLFSMELQEVNTKHLTDLLPRQTINNTAKPANSVPPRVLNPITLPSTTSVEWLS